MGSVVTTITLFQSLKSWGHLPWGFRHTFSVRSPQAIYILPPSGHFDRTNLINHCLHKPLMRSDLELNKIHNSNLDPCFIFTQNKLSNQQTQKYSVKIKAKTLSFKNVPKQKK